MNAPAVNFAPLVKSISIENLLAQRDGVLTRVRLAMETLQEAERICNAAGISDALKYSSFNRILQGPDRYRDTCLLEDKSIEQITKRLDASAWQHLLYESGIRTLMDAKARAEWDEKIMNAQVPELTSINIKETFGQLYNSRDEIFERGVINCFKALSWHYKTNRPFAFGKRLVMRGIRGHVTPTRAGGGGTSLGYVNQRNTDQLDDLSRVFHVMDGKPEPDHRQGWYSLLNQCNKTTDPDPENAYLKIRSFRNGNGHVTFKRPDLVAKMNAILARHYPAMLPADRHENAQEFEPVKVA